MQYDDTVKALMERYQQVEAQLDRSIRYSRKTESEGNTTVQRAWCNGAGDPIKVAVERVSSAGRELTEYFSLDFDDPGAMFVSTRKETTQPDGGTQVDESRQYFGSDGKLLRELRKSGSIKHGETLDTVRFPNTTVDLSKQRKDDRTEEQRAVAEIVNYIVDLTTRQILGTTNGDYFGTKQRYNHDQCDVTWSPDSKMFVEVTSWKWGIQSLYRRENLQRRQALGTR